MIPVVKISTAESSFRKQFPSPDKFQQYLEFECQGSTKVLRERIRRSLLIEVLLKTEVANKSAVPIAEARNFYRKNPGQFARAERFAIQTISIIPPAKGGADAQKEAKKRADEALQKAKATKSYEEFGLLAEKMSDDDWHVNMGDRKNVEPAKLPQPIVEAARKMKPGQVSDLFQFGSNYTLFRLNGHTPAGKIKFEDVKTKLQSDLQKAKADQLRASLNKKLRQTSRVEVL